MLLRLYPDRGGLERREGGRGSQAAKRELEAAYDDYMTHHAQDIE